MSKHGYYAIKLIGGDIIHPRLSLTTAQEWLKRYAGAMIVPVEINELPACDFKRDATCECIGDILPEVMRSIEIDSKGESDEEEYPFS
jgi:hypothetical protein